jgi:hypothetical protein
MPLKTRVNKQKRKVKRTQRSYKGGEPYVWSSDAAKKSAERNAIASTLYVRDPNQQQITYDRHMKYYQNEDAKRVASKKAAAERARTNPGMFSMFKRPW